MNAGDIDARKRQTDKIAELRARGVCFACHDLKTGELFRDQFVVFEDEQFRVALEMFPRMQGHTIILFKPHREDVTELSAKEAGDVFAFCVLVSKAIKDALHAEKVYIASMCDGGINHFHLQLLPRYPNDPTGSTRFIADRDTLVDGQNVANRIRDSLFRLMGQR